MVANHEEIKRRRIERNLSKRELSKRAGLPDNAICRIENIKATSIHPIRAVAIAKALECDISDIAYLN